MPTSVLPAAHFHITPLEFHADCGFVQSLLKTFIQLRSLVFDFITANSRATKTSLSLHNFVSGPTKGKEFLNNFSHSGFKMFSVLVSNTMAKQSQ